jgi:hypothetical protein
MNKIFKYFGESIVVTIVFLLIAAIIGYNIGGPSVALSSLITTALLGVLETSLSFDNAVVNATILAKMNHFWRTMFLTVGMIIAVFGMRLVFPIVIVWAVSDHTFLNVIQLTWKAPKEFQSILVAQHIKVAGFGGAFLWMVFSKFFFDKEKDNHWISIVEKPMSKIGEIESVWTIFTIAVSFLASRFVENNLGTEFFLSAIAGVVSYLVVKGLSSLVESGEGTVSGVASAGLTTFLYLEVLDASFSFDGVIGSFAITNNLALIALGLGIGAMFVRSLTIKMVDDNTLTEYQFLENGAFWAIGALATIMYVSSSGIEIPEVVSGLIGFSLIAIAFVSSVISKSHTVSES